MNTAPCLYLNEWMNEWMHIFFTCENKTKIVQLVRQVDIMKWQASYKVYSINKHYHAWKGAGSIMGKEGEHVDQFQPVFVVLFFQSDCLWLCKKSSIVYTLTSS